MLESCCHFGSNKKVTVIQMRFLRTKYEYNLCIHWVWPPPSDSGKWRCSLESPTKRNMSCHPCGRRNPWKGGIQCIATETIPSIRFLAPAKKQLNTKHVFKNYEFQQLLSLVSREFVPAFFFRNVPTATHHPKKTDVETAGPINDDDPKTSNVTWPSTIPRGTGCSRGGSLASGIHKEFLYLASGCNLAIFSFFFSCQVSAARCLSYPSCIPQDGHIYQAKFSLEKLGHVFTPLL